MAALRQGIGQNVFRRARKTGMFCPQPPGRDSRRSAKHAVTKSLLESCDSLVVELIMPVSPIAPTLRIAQTPWDGNHSSNPSANDTAAATSFILRDVKRVMRLPMLLLGTVWRLSKFAAQM